MAYYSNSPLLSLATAIYQDAALTLLAPDAYYSNQVITRRQVTVSGVTTLQAPVTCESCAPKCGLSGTVYIEAPTSPSIININIAASAGIDTGPFNIYTSPNGTTFTLSETGVSRDVIYSYVTTVPSGTTVVRLTSTSALCPVSIDMPLMQQYALDWSLLGGGPNHPSPYAKLIIKVNGVEIVNQGGNNPDNLYNGSFNFIITDDIYIYTNTVASTEYYTGAYLSLDVAYDNEYTPPVIFGEGGDITADAGVYSKEYEYSGNFTNNVWIKAQAEAYT